MSEKNKILDLNKIKVKYNDKLVGYIVYENNFYSFEYDDQWLKNGFTISPFFLPLKPGIFRPKEPNKLFEVFYDSLPDGWGLKLMTLVLAKNGIDIRKISPLTLLSLLDINTTGGLSYEPVQSICKESKITNLDVLNKQVNDVLNDSYDNKTLDEIFRLGGSSGGSRPKAHIKFENEDWIVKFQCRLDEPDAGIKEYEANKFAKKCGINVNEFKLFPSKTTKGYFGAKRFDRENKKKIHMISLAALLEQDFSIPNLDYISLLQAISLISVNKEEDLYEAYRRMVFNVFYGNKDDHSKNFAFIYSEKENGYRLSPFYDITKTPKIHEHHLAINGIGNPSIEDMLSVAKEMHMSIDKCKKIILEIQTILKNK